MTRLRVFSAGRSGFTLLEAIVAVALLGLIVSSLVAITGQWLPSWHRGFARVQGNEAIATALDRIVTDLGSAEYIPLNRDTKAPLFFGRELSVVFVRTAVGPNSPPGLDIVRIGETADKSGRLLVRTRTAFEPLSGDMSRIDQLGFSDPVVLLRAPYRLQFSYAGVDGVLARHLAERTFLAGACAAHSPRCQYRTGATRLDCGGRSCQCSGGGCLLHGRLRGGRQRQGRERKRRRGRRRTGAITDAGAATENPL